MHLTPIVLRLGSVAPEVPEPSPDSPSYLRYQLLREFQLTIGSLVLVAGCVCVMIGIAAISDLVAGRGGLLAGEDIGLGLSGFGMCGAAIHVVRLWVILVYRQILFSGQDPVIMDTAPTPSRFMQRVIVSSDWDFAPQALAAVFVAVICFQFNS